MTHAVIDFIAQKIVFKGTEDECECYVSDREERSGNILTPLYLTIKTIEFALQMIGNKAS